MPCDSQQCAIYQNIRINNVPKRNASALDYLFRYTLMPYMVPLSITVELYTLMVNIMIIASIVAR